MAVDIEVTKPLIAPTVSAEIGDPTKQDIGYGPDQVDRAYWERCLTDAERAEQKWRQRGREIIKIYRNDGATTSLGKKKANSEVHFNVLFANTEVMQPAIYSQPPQPVVRSRFVKKSSPPQPLMPPPMMPGGPPMGGPPTGIPPGPPNPAAPGPAGPPPGMMPPVAPPAAGPPVPPNGVAPPSMGAAPAPGPPMPPEVGMGAPPGDLKLGPINVNLEAPKPEAPPPPPPPQAPPMMPPMPAPLPMGMPRQQDIDTAASVMEKALEIVEDDEASHAATTSAVRDMLLPGRGVCRVRWHPQLEQQEVMAGDGMTPLPNPAEALGALAPPGMGDNGGPPMQDTKVWETVSDEFVYWEDFLMDPVRQWKDCSWIAFRHLFDERALLADFDDSEEIQKLKTENKLSDVLKWTEESAAKSPPGGGSSMRTAETLGDVIMKAMVWEIWDIRTRSVIWYIRELSGVVLRIDPDSLNLTGFFPVPKPLLAVTTTDTMIPKPYYDIYAKLAGDLDETSQRISKLTEKIKVRGGYNAANKDIANLLTADDGKMIPVAGVDLLNGGLQNHIWLVPIREWVAALQELYLARDQIKMAIYEVMGISDIMRGSTDPNETATAQRIKGTMGVGRLEDQKKACATFARDLMRLKAEIIAKNFDAETLTRMTGEEVTPEILDILRNDFDRTCSIDIETDSTVVVDEQIEMEGNAQMMQVVGTILSSAQGLLATGILPPPMVIQFTLEFIKMALHPIRNSRGIVELIDDFQETIAAQIADPMQAMMMLPPGAPGAPGAPGPGGPPGLPPVPPGGPPPGMNGGAPPLQ